MERSAGMGKNSTCRPGSSPSESMGEVWKVASAFVLTVTTGRKESHPNAVKCD